MDKDIALLLAEMLIKQDDNTEQIKNLVSISAETNSVLREFMGYTAEQFNQQQNFNERFLEKFDEQQLINKQMLAELKEIKQTVVNFGDVDARVKALEERENQLEDRLSTIERLLKAS